MQTTNQTHLIQMPRTFESSETSTEETKNLSPLALKVARYFIARFDHGESERVLPEVLKSLGDESGPMSQEDFSAAIAELDISDCIKGKGKRPPISFVPAVALKARLKAAGVPLADPSETPATLDSAPSSSSGADKADSVKTEVRFVYCAVV